MSLWKITQPFSCFYPTCMITVRIYACNVYHPILILAWLFVYLTLISSNHQARDIGERASEWEAAHIASDKWLNDIFSKGINVCGSYMLSFRIKKKRKADVTMLLSPKYAFYILALLIDSSPYHKEKLISVVRQKSQNVFSFSTN